MFGYVNGLVLVFSLFFRMYKENVNVNRSSRNIKHISYRVTKKSTEFATAVLKCISDR